MIIRLFLGLFAAALVFLIVADLFYELHLNWLSNLIVKLGDDFLLLSFALLLISGTIFFSKQIIAAAKDYFSAKNRVQRHTLFVIAQKDYLQRLFAAKKKQLLYFADFKRQALLAKNNKKQCSLLAQSILQELMAVKPTLSETQFEHYQQAIKKASATQEIQRLLELQHEISTNISAGVQ